MERSVFDISFQNEDLASKIVASLERVSEAFRVLLWKYAKTMGLSPIQIQILIFLNYHEEKLCNVSTLAQEFNMTKPTISDAIRALDKKGLLHKNPSSVDKRAYSISLSVDGRSTIEKVEHFANPIKNLVEHYNEKEQVQIFDFLSNLIFDLNKQNILNIQRTCFACKFYRANGRKRYCTLLDKSLPSDAIRIDCPEYEMR